MTPSGYMKPKLGFSIEDLVGGGRRSPPLLTDVCRNGPDSPDDSRLSTSPLTRFPKSILSLQQEKSPIIQRPQPINGAVHQRSSHDGELPLPAVLQAAKGMNTMHSPLFHQSPFGLGSLPQLPGIPLPPQLSPLMMGAGALPGLGSVIPRDYSLYPWLLTRHGRAFPQGLPSPEQLAYLLQPFRKPKRIRTAFSPSQLLKLEQAFEKNQYVVGAERKQLALTLDLSETQVKVWFQNRRTKEKRIQQDGDDGENGHTKHVDDDLIDEEDDEDDDMEETKRSKDGRRTIDDTRRLSDDEIDDEIKKRRKIFEGNEAKMFLSSSTGSSSASSLHSSSMFFSPSTMPISHGTSLPSNPLSTSSLLPSIDSVILAKAIIGQAKNNFTSILTDDRTNMDGRPKNIESVN